MLPASLQSSCVLSSWRSNISGSLWVGSGYCRSFHLLYSTSLRSSGLGVCMYSSSNVPELTSQQISVPEILLYWSPRTRWATKGHCYGSRLFQGSKHIYGRLVEGKRWTKPRWWLQPQEWNKVHSRVWGRIARCGLESDFAADAKKKYQYRYSVLNAAENL